MEQGALGPGADGRVGSESEMSPSERPPRMLRVRLWQAIAGMCVAIALASLIVVSELSYALGRRTNYVNRRVAALNAIVRTLRRQTATEQRKLGSEKERATEGEVFEKILFAADLRTIKLAAPAEMVKGKGKSIAHADAIESDLPFGRLAMSESVGAAMLEANGLKPTGAFQVYRIWWMPKRGTPIWAADFLVGDDGLATVPVDLPTGHEKEMSLGITLENESYSEEPAGPLALKGELSLMSGGARKSRR